MDEIDFLVVGAGMSGLSFAVAIRAEAEARGAPPPRVLVIEQEDEPGGYCRTVVQDGFVWDYSGHFFHFKHADIEAWLRARLPPDDVRTVEKKSFIRFAGTDIDFPFQKNIHQLPKDDFIECLHDLIFKDEMTTTATPDSFKAMVYERFGRGIAEKFLVPYNEKLYACSLDLLDKDAMGRFFPHADVKDIIRNMRFPDNSSYNQSFTYPRGGAIQYVNAFLGALPADVVSLSEKATAIDRSAKVMTTSKRTIRYRHIVSSAPLPTLLRVADVDHDPSVFNWNKVLVFNLGFDRKGPRGVHWMYFPERSRRFYRVGFYDNILDGDRMSLYVEIGGTRDEVFDVEAEKARVLDDLRAEGIIDGHTLVSSHHVVLDPAYVHITRASQLATDAARAALSADGIHAVGRYGGWTYCSIEDNILETRALAKTLTA